MKKRRREVSLILSIVMLLGIFPTSVFAEQTTDYSIIYHSNNSSNVVVVDDNKGKGYSGATSYVIKDYSILDEEFQYTDHTFINWNENASGTGESYSPGYNGTFSSDEDMLLYAKWSLNAPSNVKATNNFPDKIMLTWDLLSNITDYKIERKMNAQDSNYVVLAETFTGISYEDKTAEDNIEYIYRVTGIDNSFNANSGETIVAGVKTTSQNEAIAKPVITSYTDGGDTTIVGTTLNVTLTAAASGITQYYSLDGSVPTKNSTVVPSNLRITLTPLASMPSPIVLSVVASDGISYSKVTNHTFTFKLAAATSSNAGDFVNKESFPATAIITATAGATTYYEMTTDGSTPATPTAASAVYPTDGIPLDATKITKIKAINIASGTTHSSIQNSDVNEFTYQVKAALRSLLELKEGTWTEAQKAELIQAVVSQLTLDEKINLIGGTKGSTADKTAIKNSGAAGGTYTTPRLMSMGISPLTLSDGPAGVRMGYKATTWTSPTAIASSWDAELMHSIATQTGKEAKFYGIDVMLSPGQNIIRNPQSGRNFEYFSEDSYLSGIFAKSYTEGVQDQNVGVTLKHYAGNEQESHRSGGNTIVSERALREVYLKGFDIATEAKPWSVMCSYNRLNGIYACENEYLLTDMLRGEYGFNGFVMSDWGATQNIVNTVRAQMDLTESSLSAAKKAELKAAILDGQLEEYYLNQNVVNLLNVIIKSNTFKGEYDEWGVQYNLDEKEQDFYKSDLFKESNEIARITAAEAMVLLKNDDSILPLASNEKVGLVTSSNLKGRGGFGDNAVTASDFVSRGGGSAGVYFDPTHESVVSLEEALKESFNLVNFGEVKDIKEASGYTKVLSYSETAGRVTGITLNYQGAFDATTLNASAAQLAQAADYGLYVISRQTGEGADNELIGNDGYYLTNEEEHSLKAYADAFHHNGKKLVVILNIGAALDTTFVNEYADAILISWLPGQEGGHAITDVLTGATNPSGKLTQTFTKKFEDSPSIAASNLFPERTFSSSYLGNTVYGELTNGGWGTNPVFYDEDVLVGYKWFDSKYITGEEYDDKVAYPFGYGKSYTQFEFSDLQLSKKVFDQRNEKDSIKATVKVKNVGKVKGKEVVQFYLGMEKYETEGRPMKDLRGFQKVELNPGEVKTVTFTIKLSDLQYYDDGFDGKLEGTDLVSNVMYGEGKGWTVTPNSKFNVIIGNTSNNFVLNDKAAKQGATTSFVYGIPSTNNNGEGSTVKPNPPVEEDLEEEVDEKTALEQLKDKFADTSAIPSWAVEAVADLVKRGIINGKTNGNFDPSGYVTRAEFLTMIVRGFGLENIGTNVQFSDVANSAWFKSYIDIGTSNGIIQGLGDNKFGPNLEISRQDLSVIIYNAMKAKGVLITQENGVKFTDDGSISEYAKEAVYSLKQLEIVLGKGENNFDPKARATRAEAAAMIKRVLDYLNDVEQ